MVLVCRPGGGDRGPVNKPDLFTVLRHYGIDVTDGRVEQLSRNIRWLLSAVQAETDGCIEWPYGRFDSAYGCVKMGRRSRAAHRVAHHLATGETPTVVRHACDNPPCVNPRHLAGGSYRDNTQDAMERGRLAAGERHGCAKLTWKQVREIRAISGQRNKDTAEAYGVSTSTVAMIRRGVTWQE